MTREATCIWCNHVLHVSPDARDRWLTCPRCLAVVANPYYALVLPGAVTSALALPTAGGALVPVVQPGGRSILARLSAL